MEDQVVAQKGQSTIKICMKCSRNYLHASCMYKRFQQTHDQVQLEHRCAALWLRAVSSLSAALLVSRQSVRAGYFQTSGLLSRTLSNVIHDFWAM